jgi:hypothetical protein
MSPYRWLVIVALVVAAVLFGVAGILARTSSAGAAIIMILGGLSMMMGVNAAEKHGGYLEKERRRGDL